MKAFGSIQEGRLAKAQGDTANKLAQYNARMLEREGESREEAAKLEEERVARQQHLVIGRQLAQMGKSGIGITGSSLDSLADTVYQFALDRALTLRSGIYQSQNLRSQAVIQRSRGKYAKKAGRFQFGQSILSAAGAGVSGGYKAYQASNTEGK